jgi:hypothetical protein
MTWKDLLILDEAETVQKPTTMSLLPEMIVPGEKETKSNEKSAMDLFPQETGFGSSEPSSKSR